ARHNGACGRGWISVAGQNKKGTKIYKGKGASRGSKAPARHWGERGALWTPPGRGDRQLQTNAVENRRVPVRATTAITAVEKRCVPTGWTTWCQGLLLLLSTSR